MNEFDLEARLRRRLRALEAAAPTATRPAAAARRRRPSRARQLVMVLAAATGLLLATAMAGSSVAPPPDPAERARNAADEERLRADLGARMETGCWSLDVATTYMRERLDALGLGHWTIRVDDRISEARCVSGAPIGDAQEILVVASMGGDVASALDRLAGDLMERCLGEREAIELVKATLSELGVPDPDVRRPGWFDPVMAPVVGAERREEHLANGCFVYAGAQFDNVGRYTWFVTGQ